MAYGFNDQQYVPTQRQQVAWGHAGAGQPANMGLANSDHDMNDSSHQEWQQQAPQQGWQQQASQQGWTQQASQQGWQQQPSQGWQQASQQGWQEQPSQPGWQQQPTQQEWQQQPTQQDWQQKATQQDWQEQPSQQGWQQQPSQQAWKEQAPPQPWQQQASQQGWQQQPQAEAGPSTWTDGPPGAQAGPSNWVASHDHQQHQSSWATQQGQAQAQEPWTQQQAQEPWTQQQVQTQEPWPQPEPDLDVGSGLRSVTELPMIFHTANLFSFKYFNAVQSECFDAVFNSNISMVVAAPTGSGKTGVMELAMVRLLAQQLASPDDLTLDKSRAAGKVLYLAPMRALVQEKARDWQNRYGRIGAVVIELSGDHEPDRAELDAADIICSTPEKFDACTRKLNEGGAASFFGELSLVLIDEVHLLGEPGRGAALEAGVVSRIKMVSQWPAMKQLPISGVRFVAVSATIPNVQDIATWLGVPLPAGLHVYGEEMRPCKLRTIIKSYQPSKNDFLFERKLNDYVGGIIHEFSSGKPTLVFCRSGPCGHTTNPHQAHAMRLRAAASSATAKSLKALLEGGIGFHHAAMDQADRELVERLFLAQDLPVLCATSTLALGVNLPAHLVVIKGTRRYCGAGDSTAGGDAGSEAGASSGYKEYDKNVCLQMVGRAGRPQFDKDGVAVIMTGKATAARYHNLVHGSEEVDSSLKDTFAEHLAAEVVIKTIQDVTQAIQWLKSTFLYIRMQRNPAKYGVPPGALRGSSLDAHLRDSLVLNNTKLLVQHGLVSSDEDGFSLQATDAGRIMVHHYIALDTMILVMSAPPSAGVPQLMSLAARAAELKHIHIRRGEKKILGELHARPYDEGGPHYPLLGANGRRKDKIATSEEKIYLLLNDALSDNPSDKLDYSMRQEQDQVVRVSERVVTAMARYYLLQNAFAASCNALQLQKGLRYRMWPDTKMQCRQLANVGHLTATRLQAAGLGDLRALAAADARHIEGAAQRFYPFGDTLKREVMRGLPPRLRFTLVKQTTSADGRRIEVQLQLERLLDGTAEAASEGDQQQQQGPAPGGVTHARLLVGSPGDDRLLLQQQLVVEGFRSPYMLSLTVDNSASKTQPGSSGAGATASGGSLLVACVLLERSQGLDTVQAFTLGSQAAAAAAAAQPQRPTVAALAAAVAPAQGAARTQAHSQTAGRRVGAGGLTGQSVGKAGARAASLALCDWSGDDEPDQLEEAQGDGGEGQLLATASQQQRELGSQAVPAAKKPRKAAAGTTAAAAAAGVNSGLRAGGGMVGAPAGGGTGVGAGDAAKGWGSVGTAGAGSWVLPPRPTIGTSLAPGSSVSRALQAAGLTGGSRLLMQARAGATGPAPGDTSPPGAAKRAAGVPTSGRLGGVGSASAGAVAAFGGSGALAALGGSGALGEGVLGDKGSSWLPTPGQNKGAWGALPPRAGGAEQQAGSGVLGGGWGRDGGGGGSVLSGGVGSAAAASRWSHPQPRWGGAAAWGAAAAASEGGAATQPRPHGSSTAEVGEQPLEGTGALGADGREPWNKLGSTLGTIVLDHDQGWEEEGREDRGGDGHSGAAADEAAPAPAAVPASSSTGDAAAAALPAAAAAAATAHTSGQAPRPSPALTPRLSAGGACGGAAAATAASTLGLPPPASLSRLKAGPLPYTSPSFQERGSQMVITAGPKKVPNLRQTQLPLKPRQPKQLLQLQTAVTDIDAPATEPAAPVAPAAAAAAAAAVAAVAPAAAANWHSNVRIKQLTQAVCPGSTQEAEEAHLPASARTQDVQARQQATAAGGATAKGASWGAPAQPRRPFSVAGVPSLPAPGSARDASGLDTSLMEGSSTRTAYAARAAPPARLLHLTGAGVGGLAATAGIQPAASRRPAGAGNGARLHPAASQGAAGSQPAGSHPAGSQGAAANDTKELLRQKLLGGNKRGRQIVAGLQQLGAKCARGPTDKHATQTLAASGFAGDGEVEYQEEEEEQEGVWDLTDLPFPNASAATAAGDEVGRAGRMLRAGEAGSGDGGVASQAIAAVAMRMSQPGGKPPAAPRLRSALLAAVAQPLEEAPASTATSTFVAAPPTAPGTFSRAALTAAPPVGPAAPPPADTAAAARNGSLALAPAAAPHPHLSSTDPPLSPTARTATGARSTALPPVQPCLISQAREGTAQLPPSSKPGLVVPEAVRGRPPLQPLSTNTPLIALASNSKPGSWPAHNKHATAAAASADEEEEEEEEEEVEEEEEEDDGSWDFLQARLNATKAPVGTGGRTGHPAPAVPPALQQANPASAPVGRPGPARGTAPAPIAATATATAPAIALATGARQAPPPAPSRYAAARSGVPGQPPQPPYGVARLPSQATAYGMPSQATAYGGAGLSSQATAYGGTGMSSQATYGMDLDDDPFTDMLCSQGLMQAPTQRSNSITRAPPAATATDCMGSSMRPLHGLRGPPAFQGGPSHGLDGGGRVGGERGAHGEEGGGMGMQQGEAAASGAELLELTPLRSVFDLFM